MSDAKKLVYYSFYHAGGPLYGRRAWQIQGSIESLRRFNGNIEIVFCLFGSAFPDHLMRFFSHQRVDFRHLGTYEEHLLKIVDAPVDIMTRYPAIHKWTCINQLDNLGNTDVLYLDNDTYFFDDVEKLFESDSSSVRAREEPYSRRSEFGYDAEYIDETALAALASEIGSRFIPPFNTGVVLMPAGVLPSVRQQLAEFVELIWRFSLWMANHPSQSDTPDVRLIRGRTGLQGQELRYPGGNRWIKEQLAIGLALGKIPDCKVDYYTRSDVLQGLEFMSTVPAQCDATVVHFFTANFVEFYRWLQHGG